MGKKALIIKIAVIAWIVLSAAYIGYDQWMGFKVGVMENYYNAGKADTINALIAQAQKECKPFNVFSANNKVDLINVACLQSSTGATNPSK